MGDALRVDKSTQFINEALLLHHDSYECIIRHLRAMVRNYIFKIIRIFFVDIYLYNKIDIIIHY